MWADYGANVAKNLKCANYFSSILSLLVWENSALVACCHAAMAKIWNEMCIEAKKCETNYNSHKWCDCTISWTMEESGGYKHHIAQLPPPQEGSFLLPPWAWTHCWLVWSTNTEVTYFFSSSQRHLGLILSYIVMLSIRPVSEHQWQIRPAQEIMIIIALLFY